MKKNKNYKLHKHNCKCGHSVVCSAKNCEIPKNYECQDCLIGNELVMIEGTPYKKINKPATLSQMDDTF